MCEKFEGKELFYSVKDKNIFKNKTVSIFGGGDSALDWAIELSESSKIQLRRVFFSSAGSIFTFISFPECNATPEKLMTSLNVCCCFLFGVKSIIK